jgi:hypothetical protein
MEYWSQESENDAEIYHKHTYKFLINHCFQFNN